jgi:hypothetical protein
MMKQKERKCYGLKHRPRLALNATEFLQPAASASSRIISNSIPTAPINPIAAKIANIANVDVGNCIRIILLKLSYI